MSWTWTPSARPASSGSPGTGLSEEPSRTATLAALAHRAKAGITVFDLDWRPMFWKDPSGGAPAEAARPFYAEALRHATVAVGNLDEVRGRHRRARTARGGRSALLDAGVELAVVKQGPKGVLAVHRDGDVRRGAAAAGGRPQRPRRR